jgi:hypothetical protein
MGDPELVEWGGVGSPGRLRILSSGGDLFEKLGGKVKPCRIFGESDGVPPFGLSQRLVCELGGSISETEGMRVKECS